VFFELKVMRDRAGILHLVVLCCFRLSETTLFAKINTCNGDSKLKATLEGEVMASFVIKAF